MKAVAYMKQIRILDRLIDNKIQEVERLKCMATKVTTASDGDRVQSSSSQERMADTVAKIIDLQDEINADIDNFVDMKNEIIHVIDQVDDADLIDILYKRYYQYSTWEKIATEMNYTYRWVCKLHGRALQKVDAIINKEN